MSSSAFVKLEEGHFYDFVVEGWITLPTGEERIKLMDPNRVKHLILSEPYKKYKLEPGNIIRCRVDHINCTGQVFIEPQHPCYETGRQYQFQFKQIIKMQNSMGMKEDVALFEDCLGNDVLLPQRDMDITTNVLTARVTRIKKGKVYISTDGVSESFTELKHGDFHRFRVTQLVSYGDNYEYFILIDQKGREYKLRRKYYSEYGIQIDHEIRCRIIREGSDFYFEPEHPFYKIGKLYEFELIERTEIDVYPDGRWPTFVFRNDFGKNILIHEKKINAEIQIGHLQTLLVKDIRKSELILEKP
ncbi:MAG: hypothetical protein KQI35_02655 [Bacteroidetes bacterium]|nr:hypothetical protein [Bacteroidota bacterium]